MKEYDIHLNFPGGVPVDGPSAGVGIAVAVYSALTNIPVSHTVAVTGELSIRGLVCPVGGVTAKLYAAKEAGVKRVIIPSMNWQDNYQDLIDLEIIPVEHLDQVIKSALLLPCPQEKGAGSNKSVFLTHHSSTKTAL